MLKDKHVPLNTIYQLKKLKPMRQIEAAQLMTAMNKYTIAYACSLVAATPVAMLSEAEETCPGPEPGPDRPDGK